LFPQQSVAVVSISFPPLQRLEPGQIQEEEGSTRVSSRLVSSSSAISKEEEGQIQEEEEGKRKEGSTRIPGSGRLEGNVATAGIIFLLFSSFSPALSSSLAPNSLLQDLRCSGSSGQGVRKQQIRSHKLRRQRQTGRKGEERRAAVMGSQRQRSLSTSDGDEGFEGFLFSFFFFLLFFFFSPIKPVIRNVYLFSFSCRLST
jgi:hypothetical protein